VHAFVTSCKLYGSSNTFILLLKQVVTCCLQAK